MDEDKAGLALGELQLEVMRVLWQRGEESVAGIAAALAAERQRLTSRLEQLHGQRHGGRGRRVVGGSGLGVGAHLQVEHNRESQDLLPGPALEWIKP